ncbi:2OG-Fe(II) oxygenase [Tsuneonella sp. SYSU-LHT278]|uniref:2OG-Fe(II) oxygenase n=1 Tax=Tsuneonella sediminis TaxID=3416089 RepID=UPI003F7A55CA
MAGRGKIEARGVSRPAGNRATGAQSPTRFSLGRIEDSASLKAEFGQRGRIRIPGFLDGAAADEMLESLALSNDWKLVLNSGEKLFELDRKAQAALTAPQRQQLDEAVYAQARYGFQYRYETIRVSDSAAERSARGMLIDEYAEFLSGEPVLDLVRVLLDEPEIAFADAQATAYGPGHFLTAHDDGVQGKNRVAAYVLNLSRDWRLDWGGLLAFHPEGDGFAEALVPAFNTLNLFAVPQPHSVTMVAPFAPRRRYSITGWFRKGPRPA